MKQQLGLGLTCTLPDNASDVYLDQISQTRGPRGHCLRPAILFGNFQIINLHVIYFIHRCSKVLGQSLLSGRMSSTKNTKS